MGTSLETLRPSRFEPRSHDDALLCAESIDHYRHVSQAALNKAAAMLAATDAPTTGPEPAELREQIDAIDLETPLGSSAAAFAELDGIYLRDAVYFHHPKYAAHLNCPVTIPAVAAETFVTGLNTSMDTFDQSAGATLIERKLMEWTAELLGFSAARADGVFTSGGTQSNLQALLIARNQAMTELGTSLPDGLARLRIYTSADAHFSIANAAMLLGLGPEAVVAVPTDSNRQMNAAALTTQLEHDLAHGLEPMAICATAGTTDFGAIDPLETLAEIACGTGAWFHVDAAYGCGLLISTQYQHRLAGIAAADSVTVDYHKSFFQPIGSSALILRDKAALNAVTHYAEYLNPRSTATHTPNQVDKSLQTTRRFDALKLWITLRSLGATRLGTMFDRVVELAEALGDEVALRSDLRLAAPVQLSTLVISFEPGQRLPIARANALTDAIRQRLYERGQAMIAATTVDERRLLKLTLLNPNASLDELIEIIDLISHTGHELVSEFTGVDDEP